MNTNSSQTVSDWPVARNSDPMTSVEAGENQQAREASEKAVLDILTFNHECDLPAMSARDIICVAQLGGMPWTEQRLRTAIAQLNRSGLIESAGRREGASPTGRAAMTWKLATR